MLNSRRAAATASPALQPQREPTTEPQPVAVPVRRRRIDREEEDEQAQADTQSASTRIRIDDAYGGESTVDVILSTLDSDSMQRKIDMTLTPTPIAATPAVALPPHQPVLSTSNPHPFPRVSPPRPPHRTETIGVILRCRPIETSVNGGSSLTASASSSSLFPSLRHGSATFSLPSTPKGASASRSSKRSTLNAATTAATPNNTFGTINANGKLIPATIGVDGNICPIPPLTVEPDLNQVQLVATSREARRKSAGVTAAANAQQLGVAPPTTHPFTYDAVLGGITALGARNSNDTQIDVFRHCLPLIESACEGYAATIFSYGQSSSGKTFTIEGEYEHALDSDTAQPPPSDDSLDAASSLPPLAGLLPRTLEHLLKRIQQFQQANANVATGSRTEYAIKCQYVEVYNEIVYDLLNSLRVLSVSENVDTGSFYVKDAKSVDVTSMADALQVVRIGSHQKRMAHTLLNAHSSRSHAIFTIFVEITDTDARNERIRTARTGKVNLVDLAGSERLSASKVEGIHLREAASINQSLFALSRCIKALRLKQQIQQQHAHIREIATITSPELSSLPSNDAAVPPSPTNQIKGRHHRRLSSTSSSGVDTAPASISSNHLSVAGMSPVSAVGVDLDSGSLYPSPSPSIGPSPAPSVGPASRRGSITNITTQSTGVVDSLSTDLSPHGVLTIPHVPFRSSKLTMLLKDSLGGSSRTLLFACVRSEPAYLDSTLSTLRFASLLKKIRNQPVRIEDPRDQLLRQLQAENAKLYEEMESLRQSARAEEDHARFAEENITLQREMSRLRDAMHALEQQHRREIEQRDADRTARIHPDTDRTARIHPDTMLESMLLGPAAVPLSNTTGGVSIDLDALLAPWLSGEQRQAATAALEEMYAAAQSTTNRQDTCMLQMKEHQLRRLIAFMPRSDAITGANPATHAVPSLLWPYTPDGIACDLSTGMQPVRSHRKLLPSTTASSVFEERLSGGPADDDDLHAYEAMGLKSDRAQRKRSQQSPKRLFTEEYNDEIDQIELESALHGVRDQGDDDDAHDDRLMRDHVDVDGDDTLTYSIGDVSLSTVAECGAMTPSTDSSMLVSTDQIDNPVDAARVNSSNLTPIPHQGECVSSSIPVSATIAHHTIDAPCPTPSPKRVRFSHAVSSTREMEEQTSHEDEYTSDNDGMRCDGNEKDGRTSGSEYSRNHSNSATSDTAVSRHDDLTVNRSINPTQPPVSSSSSSGSGPSVLEAVTPLMQPLADARSALARAKQLAADALTAEVDATTRPAPAVYSFDATARHTPIQDERRMVDETDVAQTSTMHREATDQANKRNGDGDYQTTSEQAALTTPTQMTQSAQTVGAHEYDRPSADGFSEQVNGFPSRANLTLSPRSHSFVAGSSPPVDSVFDSAPIPPSVATPLSISVEQRALQDEIQQLRVAMANSRAVLAAANTTTRTTNHTPHKQQIDNAPYQSNSDSHAFGSFPHRRDEPRSPSSQHSLHRASRPGSSPLAANPPHGPPATGVIASPSPSRTHSDVDSRSAVLIRSLRSRVAKLESASILHSRSTDAAAVYALELRHQNARLREQIERIEEEKRVQAEYEKHIREYGPKRRGEGVTTAAATPIRTSAGTPGFTFAHPISASMSPSYSYASASPAHAHVPSHSHSSCSTLPCQLAHSHPPVSSDRYMSPTSSWTMRSHPVKEFTTPISISLDMNSAATSSLLASRIQRDAERAFVVRQQQFENTRVHIKPMQAQVIHADTNAEEVKVVQEDEPESAASISLVLPTLDADPAVATPIKRFNLFTSPFQNEVEIHP